MANFDTEWDTTPRNYNDKPKGPKIADMRAALTAYNATSYTAQRLNDMSEADLQFACVTHSLAVNGM